MAAAQAARIGQEVRLARATLGLSARAAATLGGVAASTWGRIELGDPGVSVGTLARAIVTVGLELSTRAYPGRPPRLRDTGQLAIAERLRAMAHPAWRLVIELPVSGNRSADLVLFGTDEILHIEIERSLTDFQAQMRAATAKREAMQAGDRRPVRLVLIVRDTAANRHRAQADRGILAHVLPAGTRAVLTAIRSGAPLGRDGLAWVRQ